MYAARMLTFADVLLGPLLYSSDKIRRHRSNDQVPLYCEDFYLRCRYRPITMHPSFSHNYQLPLATLCLRYSSIKQKNLESHSAGSICDTHLIRDFSVVYLFISTWPPAIEGRRDVCCYSTGVSRSVSEKRRQPGVRNSDV